MNGKRYIILFAFFCSALIVIFLISGRVQAVTFTVNSVLDTADSSLNGVCDDGLGNCTLRGAIQEANNASGTSAVTISFSIATSGINTITPSGTLPTIIRTNVTIDGSTQTGASCGDLWAGTAPTWNIKLSNSSASYN